MEVNNLTELDVAESILNAVAVYKRLRSQYERTRNHNLSGLRERADR